MIISIYERKFNFDIVIRMLLQVYLDIVIEGVYINKSSVPYIFTPTSVACLVEIYLNYSANF